jgi:hypothetical protein
MLPDESLDLGHLTAIEAIVRAQLNGHEPELRFVTRGLHMNVRRFPALVAKEEELIPADAQDYWHSTIPILPAP